MRARSHTDIMDSCKNTISAQDQKARPNQESGVGDHELMKDSGYAKKGRKTERLSGLDGANGKDQIELTQASDFFC